MATLIPALSDRGAAINEHHCAGRERGTKLRYWRGGLRDGPRTRYARHPIVGDDVVIYAGATILGRVTIGAGATIGGNVWLLSDVPPDSIVTQPEAIRLSRAEGDRLREALT